MTTIRSFRRERHVPLTKRQSYYAADSFGHVECRQSQMVVYYLRYLAFGTSSVRGPVRSRLSSVSGTPYRVRRSPLRCSSLVRSGTTPPWLFRSVRTAANPYPAPPPRPPTSVFVIRPSGSSLYDRNVLVISVCSPCKTIHVCGHYASDAYARRK